MSNPAEDDNLAEDKVSASAIVPAVTAPRLDSDQLPPHPAAHPGERRRAMGILMLCIICLGLGQTILFAILPPIARSLGLQDIQVGIIFTVSAFMWVFFSPFWGRRSDVLGRKPVILLSVGMFAVSIGALAVVLELGLKGVLPVMAVFVLLTLSRSLHGIFVSAGPAAAQAYVADRTAPEERTASLAGLTAAFGLGASIGPGIGSATVQFGPVVPLYIVTVISVLSFAAIFFWLPERSKPVVVKNRRKLQLTDPRLRRIFIYGAGGGLLMVVPIQLIGFYLLDVLQLDELSASQFLGVALMVSSMASLFAQLVLVQRLKLSPWLLLQAAPALVLFGHVIIALGRDFGTIVFGLVFAGLGTGIIMPAYNAAVSLSVKADEQGAAAGLANSFFAVGFIIAPIVAFSLYDLSPQTPFICSAIIAGLMAIYAWRLLRGARGQS
ncbi:MFS transporter [Parvularcula sp. IMCC14364]|uniref:MFS transporter n=1 Tax=Parvularcula sp. IMCC14364 TaxID=3067902 RepID=UPI0027416054|nr:MFS transporter [Parvularcula sp. IMCC14364]